MKRYEAGESGTKRRACGGPNALFLAGGVCPAGILPTHPSEEVDLDRQKQLAAVPSSASIFLFCLVEFIYTSAPASCLPILVLQRQLNIHYEEAGRPQRK